MTPYQLGEIVQTLLGYNNKEQTVDNRDVFFVADQIRGQLIENYVEKEGHTVIPQFCLPMLLPLQLDAIRQRKYVDLGSQVLGMNNNMGIVQVSLPQDEETAFSMTQAGMVSVSSKMEVGKLLGGYKCWLEGTKIYFQYSSPDWQYILVKGVPSLFATKPDGSPLIGEDEQIPQPYTFNNYLIENAKMAFMTNKATLPDKVNDDTVIPSGQ